MIDLDEVREAAVAAVDRLIAGLATYGDHCEVSVLAVVAHVDIGATPGQAARGETLLEAAPGSPFATDEQYRGAVAATLRDALGSLGPSGNRAERRAAARRSR